ncbi:MAG TPA: exopolysaccharide biosynthesis polyprenyl glycosylphosphotransferase [Baekduia sp.]|nr:exopolysaccharide biosynthesis polyprenyl glycosylphosphotransferase [Baekduia sp.]
MTSVFAPDPEGQESDAPGLRLAVPLQRLQDHEAARTLKSRRRARRERREVVAVVAWDVSTFALVLLSLRLGLVATLAGTAVALTAMARRHAYDRRSWRLQHLERCWSESIAGALAGLLTAVLVAGGFGAGPLWVAAAAVVAPTLWTAGRLAMRQGRRDRAIVLGGGMMARRLAEMARVLPGAAFEVVGYLDDAPMPGGRAVPRWLGTHADLPVVLGTGDIDRVIVAFSLQGDGARMRLLRDCDAHGVDIDVVPRLFDLVGPEPMVFRCGGTAMLSVRGRREQVVAPALKRALDIAGASLLLVLLSPVLLAAAVATRLEGGGPVLFRQQRIGRGNAPFSVLKLRTMSAAQAPSPAVDARGAVGLAPATEVADRRDGGFVTAVKDEGSMRVTRVGALLRKTSIDELPQLWNVVRGDMSLVGPRPLRDFEVATLKGWELRRQEVRPGMTGLWQVSGRSDVRWRDRLQLDYAYVRHWTLGLDLRILLSTLPAAMRGDGAR